MLSQGVLPPGEDLDLLCGPGNTCPEAFTPGTSCTSFERMARPASLLCCVKFRRTELDLARLT